MIDPKELRIGNLLLHKGKNIIVDGIDNETESSHQSWLIWVKDETYAYPIAEFDSIPITSELLERCGFINKGPNDSAKSAWERTGISCPSFCNIEGAFYCTDDWGAEWFAYCDFVHPFQNAFYSFTGTELEIKLL